MANQRFSSRTAAGTLAGLMGASLLLPAITAKAASLEFNCYSRSTQELLVKAAYDMSNEGMACLKSSAAGSTETAPNEGPLTAEAPAEEPSAEVSDASTGNAPEASDGETAEVTPSAESGRPRGIGEVIVGGIVNSLMDKLLNRLLPGATPDAGNAAMVDQGAMDAGVAEPGMDGAGAAIAEPEVDVAPQPGQVQQPSTSGRPIPKWDSMLNRQPKILRPSWVTNKRPAPAPQPAVIGKAGASKPGLGKVHLGQMNLGKVSGLRLMR